MIQITPELGAGGVSILAIITFIAYKYARGQRITLRGLPWGTLKVLVGQLRRRFFTVGRPENHPHLVADATVEEIVYELATVFSAATRPRGNPAAFGFTNSWEISYHKKGEDLNMRIPVYVGDAFRWYQLHVRGYENPDGTTDLHVHLELEPTEHPGGHLRGRKYSVEEGLRMFEAEILPKIDLATDRVDPKPDRGPDLPAHHAVAEEE